MTYIGRDIARLDLTTRRRANTLTNLLTLGVITAFIFAVGFATDRLFKAAFVRIMQAMQ